MPFMIITALIAFITAAFALQNAVVVPVRLIFFQQEASLALVIIGSVFLGLLLGTSIIMYIKFRNFWEGRKTTGAIKHLTEENAALTQKVEELETLLAQSKNANTPAQAESNPANHGVK